MSTDQEAKHKALLKKIAVVETNYPLGQLNNLGIGGCADYFVKATTVIHLVEAIQAALSTDVPYMVIGQGKNAIFSNGGFPGLVIQNLSEDYALSLDKTQMVVDAGMSVDKCITLAASQGLGGLIPWFQIGGGSIGEAIYSNRSGFLSNVRNVTIMVPVSKSKKEPAIVRHQPNWFRNTDGSPKLLMQKSISKLAEAQPVILSAVLQLTRLRDDEIRNRILRQSQLADPGINTAKAFGPLFVSDSNLPIHDVLKQVGVGSLSRGNLYLDRYNLNYLRARGVTTTSEVKEFVEEIKSLVYDQLSLKLNCRYEWL